MTLFERMAVPCVRLERVDIPDMIGGTKHEWVDGDAFTAAIVKNNTLDAKVAEKNGVKEVYTVTTTDMALSFHDAFRRVEDGAIFRVTDNEIDSQPPHFATFHFSKVSAERWVPA